MFCTWVLPTEEALALLARDRAEYARHLGEIDHALAGVDWSASQQQRASRLVIEFGRRFYALQIEWIDWAAEQIAAGTLQPGNPPPGIPAIQQAGVPGEPVLGQGRPAASQDRRDGLSCLRGSDMGWRPGPRPAMGDTGRSATATALTGLLTCLRHLRDRRRDGRQRLWCCPACWPRT